MTHITLMLYALQTILVVVSPLPVLFNNKQKINNLTCARDVDTLADKCPPVLIGKNTFS